MLSVARRDVVLKLISSKLILVDCQLSHHAYSIDLFNTGSTVVSSNNRRVIFSPPLITDGHFLALNIVNFSFLHDEGRLDDALHHFHSIELVNALRMVVSWSILVTRHRYLAFPRCLFRYDLPHTSNTMVQINSSNVQPRRVRGSGGGASNTNILSQAMAYIDTLPYLANLSPIDRLLVFVGISLFTVVTLAYMLLLSGIFTSSSSMR